MTDQEINLAVAQKLGFKLTSDHHGKWYDSGTVIHVKLLPDYAGNLNACAEMERTGLGPLTIGTYIHELRLIKGEHWGFCGPKDRCIGFLRTHEIYKEKSSLEAGR